MSTPQQFKLPKRLESEFGRMALKNFRSLEFMERKLARFRNHLHFTMHCKHHGLYPPSLSLKTAVKGPHAQRIIQNTQHLLLNERIRQIYYTINVTKQRISDLDESLFTCLPVDVYTDVKNWVTHASEAEFSKCCSRQKDKFSRLESKQKLSRSDVPVSQMSDDATVETACHLLGNTSNKAAELRSDCVQVLKQSKPPPSNISKEERAALRELKEDKDITILPADKGRATVILNKTDYQDKANDLLNDTNTYKPLKRDPTSMYRNQLIEVLQSLRDEGVINVITYRQLYPTSSDTPKFYGLPKVHKDACPLRPIVSSCGSITYNTAKFISKILSPLVGSTPRHLKNSEDLVTKLSAIKLADNESLISYDVSALFTSVPVDESLFIKRVTLTTSLSISTLCIPQLSLRLSERTISV
ncbi:uncharacterized protein [Amphiura filiformis]|uniref:uncharacterized protein n=1 Tax=Amphiura filiformis TaxID=82378 RepID=UPI003B2187AB